MQKITLYALANSTLGSIRDYANAKASAVPAFTRSFPFTLQLRLFSSADDETAYPISAFSGITSWQCVWDKDFSQTTTPIVIADNADIVAESVTEEIAGIEREFTQITIPVSSMNTQAIIDWLGSDEAKSGLIMELIGFNGSSEEEFGLQLKGFAIRNRVYYGGTPTEIDPEYLTASQVRALIASGAVVQFSADGVNWHDQQASADSYIRFRSASDASAAWSNAIQLPQGTPGEDGDDGDSAYVYVRYASDTSGSGFSQYPSASLPYIGIITTDTEIANPSASDFSGKWVRYIGQQGTAGTDGVSTYTYVGYATSTEGANFSLTPTSGLKYRAEIHTNTAIDTPTASDFSGATWVKYIGDDGAGSGDMTKSIYDTNDDGVVDSAAKLQTARSIGSASFDGTADITLASMGAQPALVSGTNIKTVNGNSLLGSGNITISASGSATWGGITGTLSDQSDLNTALGEKISMPSSGSTGQVLTKTASGVAWANAGGSAASYECIKAVTSSAEFDDIVDYCRTASGRIVAFGAMNDNLSGNVDLSFGHLYTVGSLGIEVPLHSGYTINVYRKYWKIKEGSTVTWNGTTYTLTEQSGFTSVLSTDSGTSFDDCTIPTLSFEMAMGSYRCRLAYHNNALGERYWVAYIEAWNSEQEAWIIQDYLETGINAEIVVDHRSYIAYNSTTSRSEEIIAVFIMDITAGYLADKIETLSGASVEITIGGVYSWTLSANGTLNIDSIGEENAGKAEIDINPGSYTVTAGSGLTIVDTLTANTVNHCLVTWRGNTARLKVLDAE